MLYIINKLYHSYDHEESNKRHGLSLSQILKHKYLNNCDSNQFFQKIGIFSYNLDNQEKYFEVYVRKIQTAEETLELLIYDISNVKSAEKSKIETKYKQKILAKIAHEFKTPLITIITLIQKIMNSCLI